jgi:hypothetical protein
MPLPLSEAIARLEASARTIASIARAVGPRQALWRPAPEKWSVVEVINHLADEEVEDFRTRLDLVLNHWPRPWPPIDPEGWVTQRRYEERELRQSVARFLREREISLEWLGTLGEPDWKRTYDHPRDGRISAGDLLSSWVVHDLFHVRQLTNLQYEYVKLRCEPFSVAYAGEW